jgi:hypothetical protein
MPLWYNCTTSWDFRTKVGAVSDRVFDGGFSCMRVEQMDDRALEYEVFLTCQQEELIQHK